MSRRIPLIAASLLALALGSGCSSAGDYSMEILVDGRPLPVHPHDGTAYIEAQKGHDYAIRLTNRTGERVAVALAVDGLNSIDARHTSAREARKWILDPWQTVVIPGWQTSTGTARRFVFTSETKSYGAWLGKTDDLGVVSAAFFRARYLPQVFRDEEGRIDAPAGAPEPELDRKKCAAESQAGGRPTVAPPSASAKDELAATGIGRQVDHQVTRVEFDEEDAPSSVVSFRYEFHDALVRLGVLPSDGDALARRERARGFADDGFAPDPFRGR